MTFPKDRVRESSDGRRRRFISALAISALLSAVLFPQTAAAATSTASSYVAVTPSRVLDTRLGIGAPQAPVPAYGTVAVQVTGVAGVPSSGVSAVVINVTVTQPSSGGWISAYPDQTSQPSVSNLNFSAGETIPNLVIVKVGANGKVALHNGSPGTVQLVADISGYYLGGATSTAGAFNPVTPSRVLDTRLGIGAPQGAVPAFGTVALQVTGVAGVPSSGVSAVVVNVTVTQPGSAGWISAYPDQTTRPAVSNLDFTARQTIPNLVVVKVGTNGKIDLHNGSPSTVQLIADISGYYLGGATSTAGAFNPVTPSRVLDTRVGIGTVHAPVGTHGTVALQVAGVAGIPSSGVSAVVVNVTVTQPASAGWISAYPDQTTRPGVSNLNFTARQTIPNLAVVRVGADGKIDLYNGSPGTVQLIVDVFGYYLGSPATATATAPPPPALISTSRYLRKLTGSSSDASTMRSYGSADADANPSGYPYLMLLDVGGQDQADGGVILTATSQFLTYAQLVSAVDNYVDGYAGSQAPNAPATIVIGTNNDIDVSSTTGSDWATKVIAPIASHSAVHVAITIGGADDIEPGFSASAQQSRSWLSGYLAATKAPFVFNGSADGCSTTSANSTCNHNWAATDLQWLAGGASPSRIMALPQIYYNSMAQQWKYISLTGVLAGAQRLAFAGPLTEYTACQQAGSCSSLTGNEAWNALWTQLQSDNRITQADLPYSTDLLIS